MDMHRVFIVGDSLFAETLAQTLAGDASKDTIEVIGSAPTIEATLPLLKIKNPDAVIVTSPDKAATAIFDPILAAYPDLPIIHADPGADNVQVITSQRVGTRSSDLLAAIAALPKRI